MIVTEDGHFSFSSDRERDKAYQLVEQSHIEGIVDTQHPFWKLWVAEYASKQPINQDLLIWTTVFIPRLMWSIIQFDQADRGE